MKRNSTIDFFRLIASVMVLLIHVPFPGTAGLFISNLSRFAVPFFLLVSGYYCSQHSAQRKRRETAKLTIWGTVLYSVLNTVGSIVRGNGFWGWLHPVLNMEALMQFLLFNRAYFLTNMMYYLFMLLYVYTLYIWVCNTRFLKYISYLSFALIPIGVLITDLWDCPWYYVGNWIFTGVPFFFIGNQMRCFRPRWLHNPIFILCGILMICVETFILRRILFLSCGSVFLSVGLFSWSLEYPALVSSKMSSLAKELSASIFLFHCGIRDVVNALFHVPAFVLPGIVLGLSFIISILLSFFLRASARNVQHL